jgi:uncharacterized protein (TIGR02001 family)
MWSVIAWSVIAAVVSGTAQAAEWNANVAVASDYIVRGLTRSLNEAAIQGSIALHGEQPWAAGVWVTSTELYEGAGRHAEIDYFVSGEVPLSRDWRLGGQVTRYEFTGEYAFSYDYTDFAMSLTFQDTITASVTWSPDYSYYTRYGPVSDDTMVSYELFARHPINRHWQLMAGVGRTEFGSREREYDFWSCGGQFSWERLGVSLSYVTSDTDTKRLFQDLAARDAWVVTISFRLR